MSETKGLAPGLHGALAYAGALPAFALGFLLNFGTSPPIGLPSHLSFSHALGSALFALHFVRRAFEAGRLQRYSRGNVPWLHAIAVYLYYWLQSLFIGYGLGSAEFQPFGRIALWLGALCFLALETGNAWCHHRLKKLRSPGDTTRKIPHGGPFEYVSTPHYAFEIGAWWSFALAFPTWGSLLLATLTTLILSNWSRSRHRAYLEEFDGMNGRPRYPEKRRPLFPFIG